MAPKPPKIKEEIPPSPLAPPPPPPPSNNVAAVIDLSSSDDSDQETHWKLPGKRSRVNGEEGTHHATTKSKKPRIDSDALPIGFLAPLPRDNDPSPLPLPPPERVANPVVQKQVPSTNLVAPVTGSKQFWKAGDYYDENPDKGSVAQSSGMITKNLLIFGFWILLGY
jgi:hypothetical protein